MRRTCIVDLRVEGLLLMKKTDKGGSGHTAFSVKVVSRDGHVSVIRRTYRQFVKLQERLIEILQKNARREQAKALLPKLQGPHLIKKNEFKKLQRLNNFLKGLLALPEDIRRLDIINDFFMADDQHPNTSNGTRKDIEHREVIRLVEDSDSTSPEKDESIYTCYEEASWKPQDLHRLPDKTLGRLKEKLEKDQVDGPKPLGNGARSTPKPGVHFTPLTGKTHPYASTLSLANVHPKKDQLSFPTPRRYRSALDLNGNTQVYDMHGFQLGRDKSLCLYGRPAQPRVSFNRAFCSEIELYGLPQYTGFVSHDNGSIDWGFSQPYVRTSDSDACSVASSTYAEAQSSGKVPQRNRRSRRQLPPTPSTPSRVLLQQNIPSSIATAFQTPPVSSGAKSAPRRQASIDEHRVRVFRKPIAKSISLPGQYTLRDRRQAVGRFHSWAHDDRRFLSHSNLSSPSAWSYASSLEPALCAVSDSSSESELSSGGESVLRIFEQARRREGFPTETTGLQTSTMWDAVHGSCARLDLLSGSQGGRRGEVYIAQHSYFADANGEASLVEGEEVLVMEKSLSGWWFVAKSDQQKGWVPSNFLRRSDAFHAQEAYSAPESPPDAYHDYQERKILKDTDSRICEFQGIETLQGTDSRTQRRRSLTRFPEMLEVSHELVQFGREFCSRIR